jgi:hypothetical protein
MEHSPELTRYMEQRIAEQVQALLPALARQFMAGELQRLQEEEALAQRLYTAFAPRISELAWQMTQQQVRQLLPAVARDMVQQELEQLQSGAQPADGEGA